ncbi:MAG: DNA-3-methyladenine glycosylase family protein [Candidatus Thorarchaeota archaeon]|jgi:N-glycosylase/DNA lyase
MRSLKVNNFDLKDTLECGQTFCWVKEGDGYVNADVGQAIYVEQNGDTLLYESSTGKAPLELLLRLNDPIEDIQKELNKDELMKDSIEYAPGLRVVSDPTFPCLISFLCSTRNNIPSIKRATQTIRKKYGPSYELRGKEFYGLPTPDQMSVATVEELEGIGLAWRSKFITKSTESILIGEMDLEDLKRTNYEDAHKQLQQLFGVGPVSSHWVSWKHSPSMFGLSVSFRSVMESLLQQVNHTPRNQKQLESILAVMQDTLRSISSTTQETLSNGNFT